MTTDSDTLRVRNLWYDTWKFCGCGVTGTMLRWIYAYLVSCTITSRKGFDAENWSLQLKRKLRVERWIGDDLYWFLAYWADSHGYTEHGSGIRGAWLTEDGHRVMKALKRVQGRLEDVT